MIMNEYRLWRRRYQVIVDKKKELFQWASIQGVVLNEEQYCGGANIELA